MQASKTVERITKRIKSKDTTEVSSSTDSLPDVVSSSTDLLPPVVEILPVVSEEPVVTEVPAVTEVPVEPVVVPVVEPVVVPLETNENTKGSQTVEALLEDVPMEVVEEQTGASREDPIAVDDSSDTDEDMPALVDSSEEDEDEEEEDEEEEEEEEDCGECNDEECVCKKQCECECDVCDCDCEEDEKEEEEQEKLEFIHHIHWENSDVPSFLKIFGIAYLLLHVANLYLVTTRCNA